MDMSDRIGEWVGGSEHDLIYHPSTLTTINAVKSTTTPTIGTAYDENECVGGADGTEDGKEVGEGVEDEVE